MLWDVILEQRVSAARSGGDKGGGEILMSKAKQNIHPLPVPGPSLTSAFLAFVAQRFPVAFPRPCLCL